MITKIRAKIPPKIFKFEKEEKWGRREKLWLIKSNFHQKFIRPEATFECVFTTL